MNLLKHIAMAVLMGAALEVGHEIARRGFERRRLRKLRETAMGTKVKNLDLRVKTIERLLSEHEDEEEDAESPGRGMDPAEVSNDS